MIARLRMVLRGRVQGVGFRPWLYRLALDRSLQGTITNSDAGVIAELEGERAKQEELVQLLPARLPPHAELDEFVVEWLPPRGASGLQIVASEDAGGRGARIPSDLATCQKCLEELRDPRDRRYRYPFINCTECGPRFTIAQAVPYDRQRTSMRVFPLCPECSREYQDPMNRRYHAEPTACEVCGPALRLTNHHGEELDPDPVSATLALLRAGRVVAIKGLGGFHLAVNPRDEEAVALLRRRKGREQKPLAVMVRNLEEARKHALVSDEEAELLSSARSPIVLLRRRAGSDIAPSVAPSNPYLGLMLPYTPVHHLLLAGIPALVMTSGNLTEEPIATRNEEARDRLRSLADAFLEHDREILVACDDSVMTLTPGGPILFRRSRGFVPDPIRLFVDAGKVLATGGQLKNTFCLALGTEAYLGPHVGDLDNLESYEQFVRALEHMKRLLRIEPAAVVHDLHPDYVTTRYAQELGLPAVGVQHHHAHLAAVAVDHALQGPVLGLALDGTGYGTDGTIWGGELLLLPDPGRFERLGHLRPFTLPGGEACIRAPRRTALSMARSWLGPDAAEEAAALLGMSAEEQQALASMMDRGVGLVPTTSCGRLFDAVAALCGLGGQVTYEGQPAMELEFLCGSSVREGYPFEVSGDPLVLDPSPAISHIITDLLGGVPRQSVAARFHHGLAQGWARACAAAAASSGVRQVVLGGGCFQNRILLQSLRERLEKEGLAVYVPRRIPPNDGGLALGQVAAWAALKTSKE